jgi:integrase
VKAVQRSHRVPRVSSHALRARHLQLAFADPEVRSSHTGANRWALLATGWQCLARPQELMNLTWAHLIFVHGPRPYAVVWITPLKKPTGAQPMPSLIAPGDGSGCDAYAALANLAALSPVPEARRASTPLFSLSPGQPLSHASISHAVRSAVCAAGEGAQARSFSGRSLRVGGATELAARGAPPHLLRLCGRWDSEAYRVYARTARGHAMLMSSMLGRAHMSHEPDLESMFPGFAQA